jgi:16S rRNA G966 N2-methylase RsmD
MRIIAGPLQAHKLDDRQTSDHARPNGDAVRDRFSNSCALVVDRLVMDRLVINLCVDDGVLNLEILSRGSESTLFAGKDREHVNRPRRTRYSCLEFGLHSMAEISIFLQCRSCDCVRRTASINQR